MEYNYKKDGADTQSHAKEEAVSYPHFPEYKEANKKDPKNKELVEKMLSFAQ